MGTELSGDTTKAKRHCWVAPVQEGSDPHPGLVTAWRRRDDGSWQAHVTFVVEQPDGDPVVVTQWIDRSLIRPV